MRKLLCLLSMLVLMVVTAVSVSAATGYSATAAIDVELGQTYIKGWNSSNDTKDHYIRFTVPSDGIITISYERPMDSEGEAQDLTYELYTSAGIKMWEADTEYCNAIAATLDASVCVSAGTYYLNTDAGFYVTQGTIYCDYRVDFKAVSNIEKEPNSGASTATLIQPNQTYTAYMGGESSYDYDFFKFYVPTAKKVTLVLGNYDALENSPQTYTYYRFHNANGVEKSIYSWTRRSDGTYEAKLDATAGYNYLELHGCFQSVEYTVMLEEPRGTGWYYENGGYRYYKNNVMQKGWLLDGGKWYYMDSNGIMQTGWIYIGGQWYLFNNSGVMQTGWVLDGKNWYYMKSSGAMATGFCKADGKLYYFGTSGVMQRGGWLLLNGKWYYLNSGGDVAVGWCAVGKTWYYFDASGVMKTGWVKDGNTWYYMNAGGAMQTGWLQLGKTWYYMKPSGAMVTGAYKINGVTFYFNSQGVWLG